MAVLFQLLFPHVRLKENKSFVSEAGTYLSPRRHAQTHTPLLFPNPTTVIYHTEYYTQSSDKKGKSGPYLQGKHTPLPGTLTRPALSRQSQAERGEMADLIRRLRAFHAFLGAGRQTDRYRYSSCWGARGTVLAHSGRDNRAVVSGCVVRVTRSRGRTLALLKQRVESGGKPKAQPIHHKVTRHNTHTHRRTRTHTHTHTRCFFVK